jgi:hypothetical protein
MWCGEVIYDYQQRLGLPELFVRRGRQCPEVQRIATRIGGVFQRYERAPKEAGRPVLSGSELASVRADLNNAIEEARIQSVLAQASEGDVE